MMRKALVLACVMIFALGSMASAAYIVNGSATNLSGAGSMADAVFGDWPVTATAQHAATVSTAAQLSVVDDVNADGQLLFRDLVAGAPDTWTLLVHTGLEFADDMVVLTLWSGAGPSWDAYVNPNACLSVVADPMGRYAAGEILWQGDFLGATEAAPAVQIQVHANKTTNPFGEGLLLELGTCEVIPEPGSMVAMFAGLVGLVGLRRRK